MPPPSMSPLIPLQNAWSAALHRISRWSWPFTIVVAMIYALSFSTFIVSHTSMPYYDSCSYLEKSWRIGDSFHHATFLGKLNPALYMNALPADRPPLLLAAAGILLGSGSPPQSVAMVWVFFRVAAILLALYLLSREFRFAPFVPAAAMVIFASPLTTNFTRLYMMDEPFAAFGLLAFALIVIDDRRRTFTSASGAAFGALLLFLVKPVAPAFLFPLLLTRAVRALIPLFRTGVPRKVAIGQLVRWAIPYFIGLAVAIALAKFTAYGPAISEQYKLGSTGFWHIDITSALVIQLLSFLLPPWIIVALFLIIPFWRRWPNKSLLLYTGVACAWWILFSFCLTYTVEDRLIGQAMPLVVVGLLLFLCQRPTPAFLITLAAMFFFVLNTLCVNGLTSPHWERASVKVVDTLSPVPRWVSPVPEVGLLPFVRGLLAILPQDRPGYVLGVTGDMFIEPQAVNFAIRAVDPRAFTRVGVAWVPDTADRFRLAELCTGRWYITQNKFRTYGYSNTGIWTSVANLNLLITDPQSPLHAYFRSRLESPVQLPSGPDSLTLWELGSPPPPAAFKAALEWIAPRLANDPRAAVIQQQLRELSPPKP
jgi:hypothetical protein